LAEGNPFHRAIEAFERRRRPLKGAKRTSAEDVIAPAVLERKLDMDTLEAGVDALLVADLLTIHAAVPEGGVPDGAPSITDEDAEAFPEMDEVGLQNLSDSDPEEDSVGGGDGATSAFGRTIEEIRPIKMFDIALAGILDMAARLAGESACNERAVRAALVSWLGHPLSGADVELAPEPPATLWQNLAESRPVVRPIATIVRHLLAIPATEAHCERVINVLRRMLCPFGFRMSEATILARIAARGQ
jgi:hypothetical protein